MKWIVVDALGLVTRTDRAAFFSFSGSFSFVKTRLEARSRSRREGAGPLTSGRKGGNHEHEDG